LSLGSIRRKDEKSEKGLSLTLEKRLGGVKPLERGRPWRYRALGGYQNWKVGCGCRRRMGSSRRELKTHENVEHGAYQHKQKGTENC